MTAAAAGPPLLPRATPATLQVIPLTRPKRKTKDAEVQERNTDFRRRRARDGNKPIQPERWGTFRVAFNAQVPQTGNNTLQPTQHGEAVVCARCGHKRARSFKWRFFQETCDPTLKVTRSGGRSVPKWSATARWLSKTIAARRQFQNFNHSS